MFEMDNGWPASANAWIADMGEQGDFGRCYVLDLVMLQRALARAPRTALDVGCGEGRFCRMLKEHGIEVTGVDPTHELIESARARDADTVYLDGTAERLPFHDHTFDLVVSYLSLIDIPNIEEAISGDGTRARTGRDTSNRQSQRFQHCLLRDGLDQR
jgi:2-polyprenyl-3-methyl-5-hydroxy-6-metoxy-1,4-benzoquinol methylase